MLLSVLFLERSMRGQSFSLDMVAATFLFILVILIFLIYTQGLHGPIRAANLDKEALIISTYFIDNTTQGSGKLAAEAYESWVDRIAKDPKAYYTLKGDLGVKSDFCMYLQDENGSIIRLTTGELSILGDPEACSIR